MYLEEPPKKLAEDIAEKKLPLPEEQSPLNIDLREGFSALKKFEGTFTGAPMNSIRIYFGSIRGSFIGPQKTQYCPMSQVTWKKISHERLS